MQGLVGMCVCCEGVMWVGMYGARPRSNGFPMRSKMEYNEQSQGTEVLSDVCREWKRNCTHTQDIKKYYIVV